MRRLAAVLLGLGLLLGASSCKTRPAKQEVLVDDGATGAGQMASIVSAGDAQTAPQLLRGFYGVEQGAWRWTASKFAVSLRPPEGSAERGATLKASFSIPDAVLAKTGPVSVSASVNGREVGSEQYAKAGEVLFSKAVAKEVLIGQTVTVEFTLDKFLKAGEADSRELGLVFTKAGLY